MTGRSNDMKEGDLVEIVGHVPVAAITCSVNPNQPRDGPVYLGLAQMECAVSGLSPLLFACERRLNRMRPQTL